MKEQVYIKSYEDNSYIGVEFDERIGYTSESIPGDLGNLSRMNFDEQVKEIKKFPEDQIRFADSEEELVDAMSHVKYTHVVCNGCVVSYNCEGDVI